ncbi:MAG: MATE family efflux transporter, partial [Polyangiaceae bacterium]
MSDRSKGSSLAAQVRRLALPAIAQSLLQTLVFVVDRAMLGQHGEASLAAMQIAGPLEWSLWSVFSAFTVGTIARVGLHVGAGERALARRATLASFAYAVGAGLLVTLAAPFIV